MKETKASIRYAKSLLGLAVEQNKLVRINEDMALIASTIHDNHELQVMLNSPVINTDKKIAVLKAIFNDKVDTLSMTFLLLMTNKKRESILAEVAAQFTIQYREARGITRAEVTSARGLDDNIKSQIRAKIEAKGEIEFVEKIDPSLIGGFIVRIGDKQFDGSISRSISELKKDLLKNDYIPAF